MGITPAYTGKSAKTPPELTIKKDHPRIHGEKSSDGLIACSIQGSPPHTRGKELLEERRTLLVRITPAYTGKRGQTESLGGWNQDHPRIHGEKHKML